MVAGSKRRIDLRRRGSTLAQSASSLLSRFFKFKVRVPLPGDILAVRTAATGELDVPSLLYEIDMVAKFSYCVLSISSFVSSCFQSILPSLLWVVVFLSSLVEAWS